MRCQNSICHLMPVKNGKGLSRFMEKPEENRNCYASSAQREVLLHLIANPIADPLRRKGRFFREWGVFLPVTLC
jgi:hypothetical protein